MRLSALEEQVHELIEWKRSDEVTSAVAALAEQVQNLQGLISDQGVGARGAEAPHFPSASAPPTSNDLMSSSAARHGTAAAGSAAQNGQAERLQAYDIEISRSDLYASITRTTNAGTQTHAYTYRYGRIKPTDRVIVCIYALSGEQCFLQVRWALYGLERTGYSGNLWANTADTNPWVLNPVLSAHSGRAVSSCACICARECVYAHANSVVSACVCV